MKTPSPSARPAFTLVELLVSMAIIALLLVVLVQITEATRKTLVYTTGKVEQFREARDAFEAITRRLSQATLNTYWDYNDPNTPKNYVRQSELRFVSGASSELLAGVNGTNGQPIQTKTDALFFQAPLGFVSASAPAGSSQLENLLNTWGYFIEFNDDSASRPPFLAALPNAPVLRNRFRLMEMMEPSEQMSIYNYTSGLDVNLKPKNASYFTNPALSGCTLPPGTSSGTGREWFTGTLSAASRPVHVLAENVVALLFVPKLSPLDEQALIGSGAVSNPIGANLSPNYSYDSSSINGTAAINPKNQLPPVVQVTMVAVDEASFNRFQGGSAKMPDFLSNGGSPLFQVVGNTSDPSSKGYAQDLQTLQTNLQTNRITYRVFTTNVSLKSAKWSREQKN